MWHLVTILPFFLVANVTIDRPEDAFSTFELDFKIITNMTIANAKYKECRLVIGYLKCQPEKYDTLNCMFGYGAVIPNSDGRRSYSVYPEFDLYRDHTPFEIKFNEKGVEKLIMYACTRKRKLDVVKSVVRQFDINDNTREINQMIATNMADVKQDDQNTATNTGDTADKCEYDFSITRDVLDFNSSTNGKSFQLAFTSSNDANLEQIHQKLHVKKAKQISDTCSVSTDIYGYQILSYESNEEANLRTTASARDIIIWKNGFVSSTITDGVITTPTLGIMSVKQTTSIELIGINFAHSIIPGVDNSLETSINLSSN